jgi:hypothetical protein
VLGINDKEKIFEANAVAQISDRCAKMQIIIDLSAKQNNSEDNEATL